MTDTKPTRNVDDFFPKKEDLLDRLENNTKVLKNTSIKEAFEAIDRKDFITHDYKMEAYEDYAIPTLEKQTISQPTIVAFMMELLNVQKGDIILDIGSGSGWTCALLGHMTGPEGKVVGLEISKNLVEHSRENLKKYKDLPITIFQGNIQKSEYPHEQFNKIISGISFEHKESIPQKLFDDLVVGGIIIVPIAESLWKFEKISADDFFETEYPDFDFLPLSE